LVLRFLKFLKTSKNLGFFKTQFDSPGDKTIDLKRGLRRFAILIRSLTLVAATDNVTQCARGVQAIDRVLRPRPSPCSLWLTGMHLWRSDYGPFVRNAQLQYCRRLIVVPLSTFHRLAELIGDPKGELIFLFRTSRCGSTLLSQVTHDVI